MTVRRFYLDVRDDGQVILTHQPLTRFDGPPLQIQRGDSADEGFIATFNVCDREFTLQIESDTEKK